MLRRSLPLLALMFAAPSFGTTTIRSSETVQGGPDDLLGYRLVGGVDADGDGTPDLAIAGPTPGFRGAEVSLWAGGPDGVSLPRVTTLPRPADAPSFGEALASGDLNGDGRRDLVVADPRFNGRTGRVLVYLAGAAGMGRNPDLELLGDGGGQFGLTLALGDLDGDGDDDLAVGSPAALGEAGTVEIFLGSAGGLAATADLTLSGDAAGAGLGVALAFADVNGDGADDLIAGWDGGLNHQDRVTVYHGGAAGLAVSPARTLTGPQVAAGFGAQLARVGDTDLDGFEEVAIWSGDDGAGLVSVGVYRGGAAGLSGAPSVSIPSQPHLAASVGLFAGMEDGNGDDYADLAVVESDAALSQSVMRVYFGGPSGIDPSGAWRLLGRSATDLLQAVTSLGDTNGDGLSDLAVAAPAAAAGRGEVYTVLGAADLDRDGWAVRGDPPTDDCDDTDPLFGEPTAFFVDRDGDGHGDGVPRWACVAPPGAVANNDDCNDADPAINPDQPELCDADQVDEDCDGFANDRDPNLDPALVPTWYVDTDGDGYGDVNDTLLACNPPPGRIDVGGDCDETRKRVNPGASEVCDFNNVDEDCDGLADDDDDSVDPATFTSRYADADFDGYGDPATIVQLCDPGSGLVTDNTDCDDTRSGTNPAGNEVCEGESDEDCDGLMDDADPSLAEEGRVAWHIDLDGDGRGGEDVVLACAQPDGTVESADDCDDRNALTFPGAFDGPGRDDHDCDGSGCSSVPGTARWSAGWAAAALLLRRSLRTRGNGQAGAGRA